MKKLLTSLTLSLCAWGAMAQAPAPAMPKPKSPCAQEADAKGLQGPERKSFLTECRAQHKSQRQAERKGKRDACRAEVRSQGLKGEEAKAAIKACVSR